MDVDRTIEELCRRWDVPRDFGERLRPLLERARDSAPKKRRLLVELVERSFEEEARRASRSLHPRDLPPAEWRLVRTVARVLHAWKPPLWVRLWEEARRRRPAD